MSSNKIMDKLVRWSLMNRIPLNLHLDLTYRCNERCVHCYLDHEDRGEMTTVEILRVLDEARQLGTVYVTLSGGEIFMRKDFFEILAHARKLNFDINLKTNGVMVDAAKAAQLAELGVRRIQVSVYSDDPAIHDGITLVRGSFARTIQAIRFLKEAGITVKIGCPLMQQNLDSYYGMVQLAKTLGVAIVFDETISPMINGDIDVERLRNSASEMAEVMADRSIHELNTEPEPQTMLEPVKSGAEKSNDLNLDMSCSAGHNSVYVSPYGEVFSCVQMPIAAGNVRKQPLADIWHKSEFFNRLRSLPDSKVPICSECGIRDYCQRCPGLAHMEDGDLNGPSERACELAEQRAKQAGVVAPVSEYHRLLRAGLIRSKASMQLVSIAPMSI